MKLADYLEDKIQLAVNEAFAGEVQEIVAKEILRIFREHETHLTLVVETIVKRAVTELLNSSEGHTEEE